MKKIIVISMLILLVLSLSVCSKKDSNIAYVTMKTSKGTIKLELDRTLAPNTVDNFVGLATGKKEFTDPETGEPTKKKFYNGLTFHRVMKDFMIQGGDPKGDGTGGPGYSFEDECYEQGDRIEGVIEDENIAHQIYSRMIIPYMHTQERENVSEELLAIVTQVYQEQSGEAMLGKEVSYFEELTGSEPIYTQGELKATVDYGTICMANAGPNTNGSQFFIVTKQDGCEWLNGRHTVFGKVVDGMDVVHAIENVEVDPSNKPVEEVKIISVKVK
jgi:peptidyl-prolyl cis-trans isomerase A (cyclophilin A)